MSYDHGTQAFPLFPWNFSLGDCKARNCSHHLVYSLWMSHTRGGKYVKRTLLKATMKPTTPFDLEIWDQRLSVLFKIVRAGFSVAADSFIFLLSRFLITMNLHQIKAG